MNNLSKLVFDPSFHDRLSHELRTTLTGVVGFSEYIRHNANEPMIKFTAQVVNEEGKDILRIIDAYCAAFRPQYEKNHISNFNVVDIVDKSIILLRESALVRSVKVVLHVDDNAWSVRIVSDILNFKRVVELVLHDLIESSSGSEDLISIKISIDGVTRKVKIKFLKYGWDLCSDVMNSYKDFFIKGICDYKNQAGPGVSAGLARFFIEKMSGELNASVTSDDAFCLEVVFPYSVKG
jgi:two-component system, OmpR family, aerobic respiration control sensor histidine kinase ArcB